MTEQNLSLYEALHIAKEAEQKTAEFYADAAQKTTNPWGKQLFDQLTKFERYHFQKLSDLEDSLRSKSGFISYEGKELSVSAVSSVITAKEENSKSALDILSMAMDIEVEAQKRYKSLQQQTDDPDGKDMFKKLAAEEALHYRFVSDAYWNLSERGVWELPK
jgi:rubrerythrin